MRDGPIHSIHGTRLLEGETVEALFDPQRPGLSDPSRVGSGFVLTSQRLICVYGSPLQKRSRAVLLTDVAFLELHRRPRSLKALGLAGLLLPVGAVLAYVGVAGLIGGAMGALTATIPGGAEGAGAIFGDIGGMLDNAVRMSALGLVMAGGLAAVYYAVSGETSLATQIAGERIATRMPASQVDRAQEFIATFFQRKQAPSRLSHVPVQPAA